MKKRLNYDVEKIQQLGKYCAHVRYVLADHYLEVFVREEGVPGASRVTHQQASDSTNRQAFPLRPGLNFCDVVVCDVCDIHPPLLLDDST